jgi:SWIM zinc finger
MTTPWTPERILALAPDSSSASAGRGLAFKKNWVTLGKTETAIWGQCQGSGKNPYQTRIDPLEPAFKCSCPSRKFPCKHGLGLFLLLQNDVAAFTEDTPPDWVTQWLEGRVKRIETKETKKAEVTADPKATEKRTTARAKKVRAGLEELSVWLRDLVRTGLSSVQNKPYSFWDGMGARLIDAQAPGVARMVRDLAGIASSGEGWSDTLLERLGKIHLLCEAYSRIETLPENVRADVRTAIGFTQNQDELLEHPGVHDDWQVLGLVEVRLDRLRSRRVWLRGETSGQYAMLLDFAHGNLPFERILEPTSILVGELVYFPSNHSTRAVIKKAERDLGRVTLKLEGLPNFEAMLETYAKAIAAQPWLEQIPVTISSLVPDNIGGSWGLRDSSDQVLSLYPNYDQLPNLLAISGGHPITVFGEFDGQTLLPLMLNSSDGIFAQAQTSEDV